MVEQLGTATRPLLERLHDGEELQPARDSPDLRGYIELVLRGGFPDVTFGGSEMVRRRWLRNYIRQIAERDALNIDTGRDPTRIGRYFEAYALNSAGLAQDKTIYTAAGINHATALAYTRLLTDLRVIGELPAWSSNRLSRLVKAPKCYLVDSALLGAVVGANASAVMRDGDLMGRVIETFAVAQLRAEAAASDLYPRLHHLRDAQGRHEVDVIAELDGQRVIGIEVKSTGVPKAAHARHLRWLRDRLGSRFVAGVVLHTGPRSFTIDEQITAAPISTLWS